MRTTHQHRRKTKIGIKQTTDRRKKKNREKNFSFRRFFAEFDVFRVIVRGCVVIPSVGPEGRSRGICLCQQTSRLPLEVTKEPSGQVGVCIKKEEWKR